MITARSLNKGQHTMKAKDLPRALSKYEEELALQIRLTNCEPPKREYKFHNDRRWRFDFAWPHLLFAVEVEGITHQGGRHQRVEGFENDLEKYQSAMLLGWTVYRCSQAMVKSGSAMLTIETMLDVCKAQLMQNDPFDDDDSEFGAAQ